MYVLNQRQSTYFDSIGRSWFFVDVTATDILTQFEKRLTVSLDILNLFLTSSHLNKNHVHSSMLVALQIHVESQV